LPGYLKSLWSSKILGIRGFNDGINRFLTYIPSIIADYPKMSEWLAMVIANLIDIGALKPDMLVLNERFIRKD
jgi:hypothetical protein